MPGGRRGAGEGSVKKRANGSWRARRSIGPRGARTDLSATGATRQEALDRLAEKIAAHERDQGFELTPSITLAAYLQWWTDTDLVEQVEDGLITATTRKAYIGQVTNHIVTRLGGVVLRDLDAAKIRQWQTWLRTNGRSVVHAQGVAVGSQDGAHARVEVRADSDESRPARRPAPHLSGPT